MPVWSAEEDSWLVENYPTKGKLFCMTILNRTEGQLRSRTATLHLRLRRDSDIVIAGHKKQGAKLRGRKRPIQAALMKRRFSDGLSRHLIDQWTPERRAIARARLVNAVKLNGPSRGFTGGKHSEEMKNAARKRGVKRWISMTPEQRKIETRKQNAGRVLANYSAAYVKRGRWKAGWRVIAGRSFFFRSAWEANYARYLQHMVDEGQILSWDYEAVSFSFPEGAGLVIYKPDFLVQRSELVSSFHEVKGWMCERSKRVIAAMGVHYPATPLVVIDALAYRDIRRIHATILDGWE